MELYCTHENSQFNPQFNSSGKEFGYIIFGNKKISLNQDAYLTGTYEAPEYKASADEEGNDYEIVWEVIEGWEKMEDESDRCDWDKFIIYKL